MFSLRAHDNKNYLKQAILWYAPALMSEFWDSLRDRFQEKVDSARHTARRFRQEINVELRLHSLRKALRAAEAERDEVYRCMGRQVHISLRSGSPLVPKDFTANVEFLATVEKRIRDLQNEMNQFFELPSGQTNQEEVVKTDPDKGDDRA